MRELLEAFRLPGEAQPIARITEVFAEHYISFKPGKSARLPQPNSSLTGAFRVKWKSRIQMQPTFWHTP